MAHTKSLQDTSGGDFGTNLYWLVSSNTYTFSTASSGAIGFFSLKNRDATRAITTYANMAKRVDHSIIELPSALKIVEENNPIKRNTKGNVSTVTKILNILNWFAPNKFSKNLKNSRVSIINNMYQKSCLPRIIF